MDPVEPELAAKVLSPIEVDERSEGPPAVATSAVVSPVIAPSLITTAEFMRAVADQLEELPGGCIPALPAERANLRARVRELLWLIDHDSELLSSVLKSALK